MSTDKDAAMRAAHEQEPATVEMLRVSGTLLEGLTHVEPYRPTSTEPPATIRLLAHSGGKVYEVEALPRPGMSPFMGAMLNASDTLELLGIRAGFFTLAPGQEIPR
jgi:hypothetical protein